ncbi:UDP-N-acetylmuramate dehydrogenase [Ferrimonas gelatinilytica]|uniref:UDP-N-acetylenolpyruvoylglucosamine reductase n=1 Tax=Ferrimonas gelatinilytica TaxID=1255257 RepID=A0ABP9S9P4_9GAMM
MPTHSSPQFDLQPWHTFAVPSHSDEGIVVTDLMQLRSSMRAAKDREVPTLVLGGGSNVLFTEDFIGHVVFNRLMGRSLHRGEHECLLHLGAGENWDEVVQWSLAQGVGGLENLALIPGCVGAAPIQNIGAYGCEFADVCLYVDYLDLETMEVVRLDAKQCEFDYRTSIFKRELAGRSVIIAVGLALATRWQPLLGYGPLKSLAQRSDLSPLDVYKAVVQIRQSKLPDPKQLGNAGSFFKNPVISQEQFAQIQEMHPDLPGYPDRPGWIKVPAGWLIDQAGLKGCRRGKAAVHDDQALVLVNTGGATAEEILSLARHVVAEVENHYGITLDPEVRIYDKYGELCW